MKLQFKKEIAGIFRVDELEDLDKTTLHAVLATCHEDVPYTSLVAYAYDKKEKLFLFLTPKETTKFINITRNPNVSVLIYKTENDKSDYMKGEAYTVVGYARGLRVSKKRDRMLQVFLEKHPGLSEFSMQDGVALVAVFINYCYKVVQFQKVYLLELRNDRNI